MRLALVDEFESEVAGADGDSGRFALGDDADAQAAEASERDAEAVVRGKAFELEAGWGAIRRGLGEKEELAVGEDAVYVEDDDFDLAGAVFRGRGCVELTHLTMIAWRTNSEAGLWVFSSGPLNGCWLRGLRKVTGTLLSASGLLPRHTHHGDDPNGQLPNARGREAVRRRFLEPRRTDRLHSGDSRAAKPNLCAPAAEVELFQRDAQAVRS